MTNFNADTSASLLLLLGQQLRKTTSTFWTFPCASTRHVSQKLPPRNNSECVLIVCIATCVRILCARWM